MDGVNIENVNAAVADYTQSPDFPPEYYVFDYMLNEAEAKLFYEAIEKYFNDYTG